MIEAVADASTFEFERLKEFGIKARQQGDNVRFTFQGITTQVGKNAKEIQDYLLGIGETQFAGAMADQMDTLNGRTSNLGDAFDNLMLKLGDAGLTDAFKRAITWGTNLVKFITDEAIPHVVFFAENIGLLKTEVDKLADNDIQLRMDVLSEKMKEVGERLLHLQTIGDASNASVARERLMALAEQYTILNEQLTVNTQKQKENKDVALGGGVDEEEAQFKQQAALERLITQHESEFVLLEAKYASEQLLLDEAYLAEEVSSEKHEQVMLSIAEKYAKAKQKLEGQETKQRVAAFQGMFGNLSLLMESNSKTMFEIGKAAAITNTVISTYSSAQKSYDSLAGIPIVGPTLGAAAAVAAIAVGVQRVNAIKSTSFGSTSVIGGGGGGEGAISGAPVNNSLPPPPQDIPEAAQSKTEVNVTLNGSAFSKEGTRELIDAINEEIGDGATIRVVG